MPARLHHQVEGPEDAPALVLSNSLGTTLEMWDDQAPALAERFRLVRFDSRGHGRSEVPPGPYAIEELGRDVLALLEDLGLERVHFCGLSMGGMTGMWLAVNAPERIDRLALCSTSTHMPPAEQWHERAGIARSEGMAALADGAIDRWISPQGRDERPDGGGGPAPGAAGQPAGGLRRVVRGHRRARPARARRGHHRAHAGHRGRRGPVHAARPRALHRLRRWRARGWWSWSGPATC